MRLMKGPAFFVPEVDLLHESWSPRWRLPGPQVLLLGALAIASWLLAAAAIAYALGWRFGH